MKRAEFLGKDREREKERDIGRFFFARQADNAEP
jgi:hypothetical protein